MTPEEEAQKAFEIQARRDVQDIRDLRNTPAFQRYFLRRWRQRMADLMTQFKDDPRYTVEEGKDGLKVRVETCSLEEREIRRRILKEFEEFNQLLDSDEGSARVSLDRMS